MYFMVRVWKNCVVIRECGIVNWLDLLFRRFYLNHSMHMNKLHCAWLITKSRVRFAYGWYKYRKLELSFRIMDTICCNKSIEILLDLYSLEIIFHSIRFVTTRMTNVNKHNNCLSIGEGVYTHYKEKFYKILCRLNYKWWTVSFVINFFLSFFFKI